MLQARGVEVLTHLDYSTRHLLDVLSHAEVSLTPSLRAELESPGSTLGDALRGLDLGPRDEPAALLLGLLRIVQPEDARPRGDSICSLSRLVELGTGGQRLALLLAGLLHRGRGLPPNPQMLQRMQVNLQCVEGAAEARRLLRLFKEPELPPLRPALEVGRVRAAPETPVLSELLLGLSYGGSGCLGRLRAQLEAEPMSGLAQALMARGRKAVPDSDGALLARLLRTLDRFRLPQDPQRIDLVRFREAFGAQAATVIAGLLEAGQRGSPPKPNYVFLAEVVESLGALLGPHQALPLVDRLVRRDELIPKSVPALDQALALVPDGALRGQGLVAIQHLFPTVIPLLEAFTHKGMRPDDIHVLGTPYASNPLVVAYGRLKGYRLEPGRDRAGATRSFEEHRVAEVLGFVASVGLQARVPARGFVALDDGGLLHGLFARAKRDPRGWCEDPQVAGAVERIGAAVRQGVEQTTRGLTELASIDPAYGVVTVANAPGKVAEGRVIGWDLAQGLLRELHWRGKADTLERVGVISAGTVGLQLSSFLRDDLGFETQLVDKDSIKRRNAEALGYRAAPRVAELAEAPELLYACTGHRSVDGPLLWGFAGDLASGSSAAIELDSDHLATYGVDTEVYNWARPLNFTGDGHETLTPEQIGLTRALLFLAVCQEVPSDVRGPVPLGPLQEVILKSWKQRGGDRTSKLTRAPRPPPPRPDELSDRPRHDEWMTYFRNLEAPVWPRPTTSRYAAMRYVFQRPGEVPRVVDTQRGVSFPLPFAQMPRRLLYSRLPSDEGPTFALVGEGAAAQVHPFFLRPEGVSAEAPIPAGIQVSARAQVAASDGTVEMSYAFAAQDRLRLLVGGQLQELVCPEAEAKRFLWPAPGELLAFRPEAGTMEILTVPGAPASPWRQLQLPAGLQKIEGLTQALSPSFGAHDPVLIGRDPNQAVVLVLLDPAGSSTVTLPKGAVFRGLARDNPDESPARYRVYYSWPDEPDELDRHASVLLGPGGRPSAE